MAMGNTPVPTGFTARTPTEDDAEPVTDLINACSMEDVGVPGTTVEEVAGYWTSPTFDLAERAWLIEDAAGTAAAYVDFEPHDALNEIFFDGYVHPAFRGRGLGSALVDRAEEYGRPRLDYTGETGPALTTWSYEADTRATELFTAKGFLVVRHSYRMAVELQGRPAPPPDPEGIVIRTFESGTDDRATYDSHEEGFADHWNFTPRDFDTWLWHMTRLGGFDPGLVFLACDGDEVAGGAICGPDTENENSGFVIDLWVRPRWRRRGIALALLHRAFSEFERRGSEQVALGVDAMSQTGALELYERAGMAPVRSSIIYERRLSAAPP